MLNIPAGIFPQSSASTYGAITFIVDRIIISAYFPYQIYPRPSQKSPLAISIPPPTQYAKGLSIFPTTNTH